MLNINEVKDFIEKSRYFIEKALATYDAIPYDKTDTETEGLFEEICPFCQCYTGIDKICLLIENENFVLKFPRVPENKSCRREYANYAAACRENLEDVFAKTVYICKILDYPIYAQEQIAKCFYGSDSWSNFDKSSREEKQKIHIELAEILGLYDEDSDFPLTLTNLELPTAFLKDLINYYGIDFINKLLLFLEKNNIGDLHGGNVGYLSSGTPVLFDYAGWFC